MLTGDTLGGRETCWSDPEPRITSMMMGTLELDVAGSTRTEGDRLLLTSRGCGAPLATNGKLVTVFGGLGSDGSMIDGAIEQRHAT